MKTFAIHESNLERLEKKINRIRTKCQKYGCDFHYHVIGEEFRTLEEGTPDEHVERFIIVECEGTAIVNGWTFAATIDHTEAGNIIRALKDIEIPERYRVCGPDCEHCHSKRHRKDTYIIHNEETGEFKQVGSSCLNDFTNGFSAESAALYISLFDELIQGEAPSQGYSFKYWFKVEEVLKYAVQIVSDIGYVPTSEWEGVSTKDEVHMAYLYDENSNRLSNEERHRVEDFRAKYGDRHDSDEIREKVSAVLEFVKNSNDSSDYMHNLKVIAESTYIDYRNMGFAVSMVKAYNKHLSIEEKIRREKEAADASEFVGEVGQRIEILNPTVEVITSWENQFGMTIRYKITDNEGHIFMWDSSSGIYADKVVASIKGTIKKHDEYRGCKQTWLTRCKTTYAPESSRKQSPASGVVDSAMREFMRYVEA